MNILENSPRDIESISEEKFTFLQEDILNFKGPSLKDISSNCEYISKIHDCPAFEILKKYSHNSHYQVRFIGKGIEAQNKAFCYVLMQIGMNQKKFYPHLNTLIKEQFYRPEMFIEYNQEEQKQIHKTCQNYFSQIRVGAKIQEFFNQNHIMIDAFLHILKKTSTIQLQQKISNDNIITLSRKFNIDCEDIPVKNSEHTVYNLGINRRIHIFKQKDLFFVGMDTSKLYENLDQFQHILQQERELSDKNNIIISQLSEQNTPKFKENMDSILYHRKSHKNIFGGDNQVINYKELVSTLKKKYSDKLDPNKVFSERLQEKYTSMNILGSQNQLMRGSHIQRKNYKSKEQQQQNREQLINSQIFKVKKRQLIPQSNQVNIDPKLSFSKNDADKFIVRQEDLSQLDVNFIKKQPSTNQMGQKIIEKENSIKFNIQNNSQIKQKDLTIDEFLTFSQKSKIKNRKLSYLSQNKKSEYFEKNLKKSFDIIQETDSPITKLTQNFQRKQNKLKFQQNPVHFSQLMNNDESDNSSKNAFRQSQKKSKMNLSHQSNILSYIKQSVNIQPQKWIARESTYYFKDKPPQKYITERKYSVVNPTILPKIETTNIRSTIDTHCISNKQKLFKKQMSQASIQNPQKNNAKFLKNLKREKSLTSIQLPDTKTYCMKKNKIKVNFNYISSQEQKNLINTHSAREFKPLGNKERPIRFAFSPKASVKTFW